MDINAFQQKVTENLRRINEDASLDLRFTQIEEALTDAAQRAHVAQTTDAPSYRARLHHLIDQRRHLSRDQQETRKQLSKAIKKEIRRVKQEESNAKIHTILSSFSGLKKISDAKTCRRKTLVSHMTDTSGRDHTDRQSIADIFADFYEQLYASRMQGCDWKPMDIDAEMPKFTRPELERAIRSLNNGRAGDRAGVFAEFIKNGGDMMFDVLLDLYNQVVSSTTEPQRHGGSPSSL